MSTPFLRTKIAQQIVNWEARRDAQGKVEIYNLPSNDGGGPWECCGVNVVYDEPVAKILRELVLTQQQDTAEQIAVIYIAQNTDGAEAYGCVTAVEATIRDCIFNRGPTGAVKTLQIALGVTPDGQFGPQSSTALAEAQQNTTALLQSLHDARKTYELTVVGERSNLEAGLQNRWDECLAFSLTLV